jgi:hypothetical protein
LLLRCLPFVDAFASLIPFLSFLFVILAS